MKILAKFLFCLTMVCLISFSTVGCTNIKAIGSDKYYIQVLEDGLPDNSSKEMTFYKYNNLSAYNEKGEKIQVSFESSKNLRKGAFLELRVRHPKSDEINEIVSYEEVQENELPKLVKEKLNGTN